MAKGRESKIELTAYDDLFETDESRAEAALSKIRDIPISEIDEFPDHPFKVLMNEDMEQLVESVKRNGIMTPATVRLKEDGRYELISGHRRKKACELAGLETLKCEVKELTRDEAIIVMVESNLQRSVILPSEKAFAYKMRLEAMKRQGQRSDLTSSPMATKLQSGRSDMELGELVGESKDQIRRYIRLTELVPEILQMVDDRQIAFRPAVEISYLSEEQQYTLLEAIGLALLVLFFVVGVMRTAGNFAEIKRPEQALKLFIRFALAKGAVTYGLELMMALFKIVQGIISTIMNAAGFGAAQQTVLPQEIVTAVEDCGFFESIPLWAVTLIGGLFITVLSFIMIMSVYGRFFKLYLYTAIAPVPLSAFAGEPSQSVGKSFIKSYAAVCLEGAIIVLACIIFSVFAASPPVVNPDAAAVTMVWGYIGELVFNMLVLVGAVKMADRVVREMMGL